MKEKFIALKTGSYKENLRRIQNGIIDFMCQNGLTYAEAVYVLRSAECELEEKMEDMTI